MKRVKILAIILLILAVPVFVLVGTSYAGSFHTGDTVTVKKGETIDHTIFAAGNNIEIDGTVKGDVFCAGQNITINGTVEGDILCAGMNVDISGTVLGDVRAAGQVVTLSAAVNNNASLAGSSIKTTDTSTVGRDLQVAGNTLTLGGMVGRDADIAGSTIAVNGKIGRDVQAMTDNLQVNADATIKGNVTYYSHNQLAQDSSAHISGMVARKDPPARSDRQATSTVPGIIFSFLALLTLAYALLALLPQKLKTLTDLALTKPGTTILIGLAACIGVPVLILISFLTVIGVYVGILLLLAWIIVMLLSGALTSYYVGRLVLMRSSWHPFMLFMEVKHGPQIHV